MTTPTQWLIAVKDATEFSPLGELVANLLHDIWGIHNAPFKRNHTLWADDYCVDVILQNANLATVDFNHLTRLVVLCHHLMLRLEISPYSNTSLRLMFHQRKTRTGRLFARCPRMIDHIQLITDHSSLREVGQ